MKRSTLARLDQLERQADRSAGLPEHLQACVFRWPDLAAMDDDQLLAELQHTLEAGGRVRFVGVGRLELVEQNLPGTEARAHYAQLVERSNRILQGGLFVGFSDTDARDALAMLASGTLQVQGAAVHAPGHTDAGRPETFYPHDLARRITVALGALAEQLGIAIAQARWERPAIEAVLREFGPGANNANT